MNFLKKLKRWIPQYKTNITLALPVVMSQVGQVVVQLVDNAMVGQLGAAPLAAVSFGGALFMLMMLFGLGLTLGLTPLVGAAYSQKRYGEAAVFFQNSLLLYTVVGVALFVILKFISMFMGSMGQDEEIVKLARPYFGYIALSIIPFMFYGSFKQFLEGVGNTTVGMVVVLVSNVINIIFNYLLIYGKFGFPEMGAAGAGLSTLISRICMPIFVVGYFMYKEEFRRYFKFFAWSNFRSMWTLPLIKVGLPISLQIFMEAGAFSLTSIMMGWIGAVQLAAHQIAQSMASFAFMILVGVSTATTICVSHEFGRGNIRQLNRAAMASFHLGIFFNAITATLFILFRNQIPWIFTSDPEVVKVASQLLIMAAFFQFSDGLQIIALGILRGIQDVKIAMRYSFLSYIVINLPVGYLCAFVLGMGAVGLWVGFIFGLSIASILFYRRYRKQYRSLRLKQIGC